MNRVFNASTTPLAAALLTLALGMAPGEAEAQSQRAVYESGYCTQTYGRAKYYQPMPYGGSIAYQWSETVANGWNATIGLSASWLSGQVGFQVEKAFSFNVTRTFNMAPKKPLTVRPVYGWLVTKYGIYNGQRKVGTATVRQLFYAELESW